MTARVAEVMEWVRVAACEVVHHGGDSDARLQMLEWLEHCNSMLLCRIKTAGRGTAGEGVRSRVEDGAGVKERTFFPYQAHVVGRPLDP